ncbi:mediator of RNA polymerase II transcription subunit 32 [Tanacetum coccineum]
MDNIINVMNNAYQELINAVANTFESKKASNGQVTTATDVALGNLKQRWELFRVTCDQAQEFLESVKLRIGFGLVKSYDMLCTVESASLEPTFSNKFIAEGDDILICLFDFSTGEETYKWLGNVQSRCIVDRGWPCPPRPDLALVIVE